MSDRDGPRKSQKESQPALWRSSRGAIPIGARPPEGSTPAAGRRYAATLSVVEIQPHQTPPRPEPRCRRRPLSFARLQESLQCSRFTGQRLEGDFACPVSEDAAALERFQSIFERCVRRIDSTHLRDRLATVGDGHHVTLANPIQKLAETCLSLIG